MNKKDDILNLLLQDKLISSLEIEEIKSVAASSKKSIEEILLEKKIVDYEDLAKVKAKLYDMQYENLASKKMPDEFLSIIPIEVAENYKIICFNKSDNIIKVGIVDPGNFKAIEAVDFLAKEEKFQVEYYVISDLSFNIAFKQYKTLRKEITTALKTKAEEEAEEFEKVKKKKGEGLEEITKTAPVAKIVSVIMRHAVDGKASDIHIEPLPKETRVRYRIDGILGTSLILPKDIHSAIVGRIKVLANLKLDETRIPQDGRIKINLDNRDIDLRVSVMPLLGEEKVVMRILDVNQEAIGLEELGFIGSGLEVIKNNMKKSDGMFLVTGPTGSGKSTTIFTILNKINKEGINISTLEDPIEYYIKGVNQSQVKPEIGYTFATGLRSMLRQDPDIIMVGEIRDKETAELAVHAGLTGHFVLSTLHTNDAIGAVPRLIDMDIEPFLLGSTLNTIVAQRLVRKICSHCKIEDKLPSDILSRVKEEVSKIPENIIKKMLPDFNINKLVAFRGSGCSRCGNSGYSNRMVIAEVINVGDEVRDIIMSGKKNLKNDDVLKSQKFLTIRQDSLIKVLMGLTSMEEVVRVLPD